MKKLYLFLVTVILLASCSPSSKENPAIATQAQIESATPASTPTLTSIPTQTPTPTITPLPTLTPQGYIITKMDVENMEALSNPMNADVYTVPKENFDFVLENAKGQGIASNCPKIWIQPVPNNPYPYYAVIFHTTPEAEETIALVAIRPTISELKPYSVVSVMRIPPNTTNDFFVGTAYQTPNGVPNPEELEISIVFPGCDIYKEDVRWP